LNSELYLVAYIIRVGKILFSESSTRKSEKGSIYQSYRRPYGVGILPLTDLKQFDNTLEPEERESTFKIFSCEEKDFYQLHELIIKKNTSKFNPINTVGSNYGIAVSLRLIQGGLGQAQIDQPMLFQGTITRKMGFPDVVLPGDVRNDLFITLDHGEFERGGKSTAKNIEVSVLVCDSSGNVHPDAIYGAAGMENNLYYRSMIIYHNNSPSWNESLRLLVPIDKFANAHIRFEFRHCSTRDKSEPKMFGFSFLRLMEQDGATIADGHHELFVYKCEDHSKLQNGRYLVLPCSSVDDQAQPDVIPMFAKSGKETFFMKSLLCSTKLTQNGDLLSLLQWRNHPEKIQDSLARVLRLKDEELVKFLQDVLDALFALFSTEDGNSTEHSGLVFHVLVSIFSLLHSNKFEHFKPVIDAYIENHFAAALVYKGLLSSVQHCAEWLSTSERPEPIQKCFESIEYIFKLIIQSRKLFSEATGGQFEESFRRDLQMVFISLDQMLASPSTEVTLPTQEAMLNASGIVFEQLENTLSPVDIGVLIRNMIDAVPRDGNPNLVRAKLNALKTLVSGKLFINNPETRSIILIVACQHFAYHFSRRDELKLCSEILGEILIHLKDLRKDEEENIDMELFELCRSILGALTGTVMIILTESVNVLSSLIVVLLGLLELMKEEHYKVVFDDLSQCGETKELKDFLHRSLLVFKELLTQDVFPKDWLVMKMSVNHIIRKALEEFAKPLVYRFLGQSFDSQLWCSYFNLAVTFLTQPSLQIEHYHEAKRRKILTLYGDMRVSMGIQILSMWSQLGNHKLHFIPSMVGPFLEVTLVPEPDLRKSTLSVFYDMMQCEQADRGSFRLVESELIDKLDILISENKGDDEYREVFSTM
jgi:dedicator of cytokinesis protein 3